MSDFDFQSYILKRKADSNKTVIHMQNYAYLGDIERRRQLSQLDVVQHLVSLGLQAWKTFEGRKIQAQTAELPADDKRAHLWADVCFDFQHAPLPLKLYPPQKSFLEPFGGFEGTFFTVSPSTAVLPKNVLKFIFGRGIGALDNDHIPWLTLSRFANHLTRGLFDKATQIPELLLHWRRCADITEDRAGLLAARDISAAIFAIMKCELDWNDDEILKEIQRYHHKQDVDWGELRVEKRVRALEAFMQSRLYLKYSGCDMAQVDRIVSGVYSIF